MSLINDALKKAQQAQAKGSPNLPKLSVPGSSSVAASPNQINVVKIVVILIILASVFGGSVALIVFSFLGLTKSEVEVEGIPEQTVLTAPAETTAATLPTEQNPPQNQSVESKSVSQNTLIQRDEPTVAAQKPDPLPVVQNPVIEKKEQQPPRKPTIFGKVREVVDKGNANMALAKDVMEDEPDPLEKRKKEDSKTSPSQSQHSLTPTSEDSQSTAPIIDNNPAIRVEREKKKVIPQAAIKTKPKSSDTITRKTKKRAKNGQNPEVLAYLDRLQIQGIKLSGNRSKVLMNNKVYGIKSLVNRDFGLRIYKIRAQEIIFVDDAGVLYRKSI